MSARREKRVRAFTRYESTCEYGEGVDRKFHMCSTCVVLGLLALISSCPPELLQWISTLRVVVLPREQRFPPRRSPPRIDATSHRREFT